MYTVKLAVKLAHEVMEVEMPSATTVAYACFRVAEALGEGTEGFEFDLVPANGGCNVYPQDMLVSEIQGEVLLVGRKRNQGKA